MIVAPGLPEDLTLLIELSGQILAQISQSVLELFLKGIQNVVHVSHGFHGLLLVFLDFPVSRMVMVNFHVGRGSVVADVFTYVYVLVNRCSSWRLDSILAFFMSSKSWDMSFI